MEIFLMKLGLYLVRWQLSTPILALVPITMRKLCKKEKMSKKDVWLYIILANFIGAFIFFWVDKWIFKH